MRRRLTLTRKKDGGVGAESADDEERSASEDGERNRSCGELNHAVLAREPSAIAGNDRDEEEWARDSVLGCASSKGGRGSVLASKSNQAVADGVSISAKGSKCNDCSSLCDM